MSHAEESATPDPAPPPHADPSDPETLYPEVGPATGSFSLSSLLRRTPPILSGGVDHSYATVDSPPPSGKAPVLAVHRVPVLPGYDMQGELGRGGMGIVYRAFDRKRGQLVALKTLQWINPAALYRFKQEFRVLANVAHPNLVSLYELVSDGEQWCFTMEIIDGVDLLSFIRADTASGTPGPSASPLATVPQWQRLRDTLVQLAEGLAVLHEAGKLHRDVKPSNALVTPQGRVVLLDFGLAADLSKAGVYESAGQRVVGTVAYMSPEQGAGQPVSAATDWYSVGVILYEALTGRLPFTGDIVQVLNAKVQTDPPPPRQLVPGAPADLDALCVDLLRRDPAARPSGAEVLRRLNPAHASDWNASPGVRMAGALLGRESELRTLDEAFADVQGGQTVVLHVAGRPGMGKSTLIQHFLERLERDGATVVLRGQCYENESVPYKAFDSLVDSLSQYLEGLPPWDVQAILPADSAPLARVFPTLGRLAAAPAIASPPDPQELRRLAFAGLRTLLTRLGERQPLVLAIDDLQWGDLDSLALYFDLLRRPGPPRMLFLASYRSEEVNTSPFLQALLASDADGARRVVAVEALSEPATLALALRLLTQEGLPRSPLVEAIARESGGNPFFVAELVQHVSAGARRGEAPAAVAALSLPDVLWARVQRLPAETRRLLEVLAVAGRPIDEMDAAHAAGLGVEERAAAMTLRAHRLARGVGSTAAELLTTYHDRVRETIVAQLPPARARDTHERLALTLEATGTADPEALALHFHGAGAVDKARGYFILAAEKAVAALAFDRAARFYQAALPLLPAGHPGARALQIKLADALANARRGAEAAPVYLEAAAQAPPPDALELRRKAAEQWIGSGRIDEGMDLIRGLLRSMGMRLPATPFRALLAIAYYRFRVWLRGLTFRERAAAELSAEELVRIDTCWSIGLSLCMVDPFRGLAFQSRCLLLALQAGEPYRVARVLGLEIGHSSTDGGRSARRTAAVFRTTQALAERLHHPHALAMTYLGGGVAAYFEGRWREARVLCDRTVEILRSQCTGVTCELNEASFHAIRALDFLGELKELAQRLPALLQDATARGDRYAATNLRTRLAYLTSLMNDDPGQALDDMRQAMAQWSHQGFHLQHYFEVTTHTDICHYRGDAQAAWTLLSERWPALKRSLLMRVQISNLTLQYLRARSAVTLAAEPATPSAERDRLLKAARTGAQAMEREHMAWSDPQALLIRAGIAAVTGDLPEAVRTLADAETGFRAADMRLYAAAARRQRGQLLGGAEGECLIVEADACMTAQSIRNPARWTAMYAPFAPFAG